MTGSGSSSRIVAIVLAAGASTRLGFPKQLIVHEGESLVRRMASAALEAGASSVVVVLGANAEIIAPELSGLPSVSTVVNHDWAKGLSSSLVTGLATVLADPACDAVLVALADQALVNAGALRRLMTAFDGDRRIIASAYADTIGVPAVFAREHFDALMHLTGDSGARAWLRSRSEDVTCVPLPGAVLDVDVPADYIGLSIVKVP